MPKPTYYLTTPIYYPSGNMHIGHTYTTVAADTMIRFKKQTGYDTYFLTGTDEHGQKIEKKAAEAGVTPIQYVDKIVAETKDLWKLMNIEYDDFIRTTEDRHMKIVQKIFKQFYDQGDIYKSEYEGLYCTPCESFWTPTQVKNGCCPDCGRPVEPMKEESYFFRMSKYQDWMIKYIEDHPDFIQPPSRANEMLNNFLRPGLQDLCVSRTSFKWGVPVGTSTRRTPCTSGSTPSPTTSPPWATVPTTTSCSGSTGRRTCTWWARRSCASTPSTGPSCCTRWGCPCPSRSSATAGCSSARTA